jgi:Putative beta-barrel porin-2, OmpL-like. bbp2
MTADAFCRHMKPTYTLVAALVALAVSMSVARGAQAPPQSVDERLQQLEKRSAELEQEVGTLKGKLKAYESGESPRDSTAATTTTSTTQPAPNSTQPQSPRSSDFTDQALTLSALPIPSKYGDGFDLNFWTWLQYQRANQDGPDSWWAAEFELDLTKSFGDRIAASADVQVIDESDEATVEIEQAFVSFLLSPQNGTILTAGKFNSPWGIEGRDYWDRLTGTVSLIFRAQPQDVTGVMLTYPAGKSGIILRPFVALGFDDTASLNDSLAGGVMIEYRPSDALSLAATGWYGPGVAAPSAPSPYGSSIWTLTNAWYGPEFESADGGHLQFMELSAYWHARRDLTLGAEYLIAHSHNPGQDVQWNGVLLLANYDINDRWRVYTDWSYLNDPNGVVTGVSQRRQEVALGVGFRPHQAVDFTLEYRYDASDELEDLSTVTINGSFGF